MGQLYYPPRNTMLDVAKLGVQLYGLKKGLSLQKGQQDIARQRLALQQRESDVLYGKDTMVAPGSKYDKGGMLMNLPGGRVGTPGHIPGLKEREMSLGTASQRLAEHKQAFEEKKFEAEQAAIGASKKPVTAGQFAAMEASLPVVDKSLGFSFSKSATGYLNNMKNLTKQGMVRRDLYEYSRTNWDTIKQPFVESAQKEMETAAKNNDTEKIQTLTNSIDALNDKKFLDQFYPNSARARQAEEATAALETLKATKAPKTATPEQPGVALRREVSTAKDVAKAEEMIADNPENPAIAGHIETFNRFSKKPYMYVQMEVPGKLYGTNIELKKIKLPKVAGRQVTAADVSYTAEQEGITPEEVLQQLGVEIK